MFVQGSALTFRCDIGAPMKHRLLNIQALRGLAALAVVWIHATQSRSWEPLVTSGSLGDLGVDVFFVISGFVIPYSLPDDYQVRDLGRFMLRRMTRLEPPVIACIAMVLILQSASAFIPWFKGNPFIYTAPQIALHFFYLIPFTPYTWIVPVFWTLSFEFFFYIAVGTLWPTFRESAITMTFLAALAAFSAIVAFSSAHDLVLASHVFEFFVGIVCARYYMKFDGGSSFFAALASTCALLWFLAGYKVAIVAIATGLIIVFSHGAFWRKFAGLGAISYSLYLVHQPILGRILNIGDRFGKGAIHDVFWSLVGVLASIAVAVIWWRYIERPAIKWSRRIRSSDNEVEVASKSIQRSWNI